MMSDAVKPSKVTYAQLKIDLEYYCRIRSVIHTYIYSWSYKEWTELLLVCLSAGTDAKHL
jgi:hypothetical protein